TGLTPNTIYHYRAISTDSFGQTAASADATFATAVLPEISGVNAAGITDTSATITWTTDQQTTSRVEYGTTSAYGSTTTVDPALVTSHTVTLPGLSPTTQYHYRVVSANGIGVANTSGDATFTTFARPVLSNIGVS